MPVFAGGGLLLVVVAAAVFWLVRDPPSQSSPPPSATIGIGDNAATPVTSPANSARSVPTAAPHGIVWTLVGQVAVPVSKLDGPATVTATRATGFAQTPVGALIAATQTSTRAGYSSGRQVWEPVLEEQFVASADRDILLQLLRDADAQNQPFAGPGELSQVAGFRYVSYTSENAVVALVRRTPKGGFSVTTLAVQWIGGDWRLVAPPGGHWPAVTTTIPDLTGVVAWGAG